jgi:protein TonB
MKIGLSLLVVVIGVVTLFLLNGEQTSQTLAAPASCGCSQPLASNVPCLVSATEDTFNQKVLDRPQPVYPADAKTARISGDVSVGVIVNQTGNVIFAWVEKADNATLSSAALDAAYKLRVKPTVLSGQPVNLKSVVTYSFRLT